MESEHCNHYKEMLKQNFSFKLRLNNSTHKNVLSVIMNCKVVIDFSCEWLTIQLKIYKKKL